MEEELKVLVKKHGVRGTARLLKVNRRTIQRRFRALYGVTTEQFYSGVSGNAVSKSVALEGERVVERFNIEPIKIGIKEKRKSGHGDEASLVISDLHDGKLVSEDLFGLEYNSKITAKRFEYLIQTAHYLLSLRRSLNIRKLHLIFLGDLIEHAYMREGQACRVDYFVTSQVKHVAELIAGAICFLSKHYEISCTFVSGNHGRMTKIWNEAIPEDNFDHQIGWIISKMFPDIKVELPKTWTSVYKIAERSFLLNHGQCIKSWSGTPYLGIERAIKDWVVLLDSLRGFLGEYNSGHLDGFILGHFHKIGFLDVNGKSVIMNGAFFPIDEHGERNRWFSRPGQQLLIVNKNHGLVSCEPIWLLED